MAEQQYANAIVLVAVYVCVGEKMLWMRRGIEPRVGLWAIPGGYMEQGETPEEAACRELQEETGIHLDSDDLTLVSVSTLLHMAQTHLVFRCHLPHCPVTSETEEALEFAWFTDQNLPWEDLAFPIVTPQVQQMYRWLKSGRFGIRIGFVDEQHSHYKHYLLADDEPASQDRKTD